MGEIDFTRVLTHLIAGELSRLRHTHALAGPLALITGATTLDEQGLGVDSLELLALAGAVNEMFHLHETSVEEYLLHRRTVVAWAEVVSASWAKASGRITFRTAGSTGNPKACCHASAALWEEAQGHAAHFKSITRILSFVPAHHIYGFIFTVLLPKCLQAEVIDCRLWPISKLNRELRSNDLIVAVPTLWEYISQSLPSFRIPLQGVTSTAPLPTPLADRLAAQGLTLTEIYGSSETAGIARRVRAQSAFELLAWWERSGSTIKRRETFASTHAVTAPLSPVIIPDRIQWLSDREFTLGGRLDGAVQVGGTNVFPERIAARIKSHPAIADCAVRLMSSHEGNRLKAFVVWKNGVQSSPPSGAFESWLRSEFSAAERPTSVTTGLALPRNEFGKLADWSVVTA